MVDKFEPVCRRMEWLDPFYKTIWEKAYENAIPISGTFELTPRCNFNCHMCYVHLPNEEICKYGKELSAEKWISLANEVKDAGTTWLCITGGEPLLHPEFEKIYINLAQMGFFITLQTNGSLVSNYKELFKKYPPRGVKITLYGASNDTYKKVCRVDNGFIKVHQGIQFLKKLNIPIKLISTITTDNIDDLEKMAFYAHINRLSWSFTGGIRNSLRGANANIDLVKVKDKIEESEKKKIKKYLKNPIDTERKPCTYCKDYRLGYWITWNGNIQYCSFLNEPQISIKEMRFIDAWKKLIKFEDDLDWPKECKTCNVASVCFKCSATLATHSGSVHKVNQEYCNKIKKYYKEVMEE